MPALFTGGAERGALVAALMFVEGVGSGWGAADLLQWFSEHGAALGRSALPATVRDIGFGSFDLEHALGSPAGRAELAKLLGGARKRVATAMRGLLVKPSDDRFLQAAIFAGRVRRERRGKSSVWVASAGDADHLSDVVLSLLAVDILTCREFHEENLCVCDVCGRISFSPATTSRAGCPDHVPARDAASGVRGSSKSSG